MFSSSDFPLKVNAPVGQVCHDLHWNGNSSVCRKIQPTEFSPLGSISMTHCLICRNGSAEMCDKLNGKDRKDTSRIHFQKLKPILFLILSRGHLIPDPSHAVKSIHVDKLPAPHFSCHFPSENHLNGLVFRNTSSVKCVLQNKDSENWRMKSRIIQLVSTKWENK